VVRHPHRRRSAREDHHRDEHGLFDGSAGLSEMDAEVAPAKLHTPIFYLLGGETDIAYPNGGDDLSASTTFPCSTRTCRAWVMVAPTASQWRRAAAAVVAWLDWQLRGDKKAAKAFRVRTAGCA
jgi:hypothetical protein